MAAAPVMAHAVRSRAWVLPVAVGLAYLGLAQLLGVLTDFLAEDVFQGPVFWPAAGIGFGAMLITTRDRWPWILLAVFVGETVSNLFYGVTPMATLGWALANTLHPLVAATLLRRCHPQFTLRTPLQLAALIAYGGVVGPAVSAVVGTATTVMVWNGTWSTFWTWWAGDGLGTLVIAPLFVAFRLPRVPRARLERVVGVGLLVAASLLAFRNWGSSLDTVLPYLVLPPLVWAALRLGVRGAAAGIATVGLIGGWSTSLGYGPFAAPADVGAVMLFQLYLTVLLATSLLIAVLVADLTDAEEIHRDAERRRRQQAALAALGEQVLAAEDPAEVVQRLGEAVRAIDERPTPHAAVFVADDAPHPDIDPWQPLARHRELLERRGFTDRYRVTVDELPLAMSVATIAANALDRLEQEAQLRQRATELEGVNARLSRAIAFREELISLVSHELRGPLTPILGFADVLRRSLRDAGDVDQELALDAIERNAERLLDLIDDILLSARTGNDGLVATPRRIDVAATIERALEHVHDEVAVTVASTARLMAWVDPVHLGQCVLNLVSNAEKYGRPPVTVHVRREGSEQVAVEVRDHGIGVAQHMLPVLFDRFTQADDAGPDPSGGVGLGLSIVRTLVEANGGHVSYLPPDEDAASTFLLLLPRVVRD